MHAVTGAHIVAEVLHRVLIAEARAKTQMGRKGSAVRASQWARTKDGLLVNDSLTAAMMKAEGIGHLASADAAFLRLEGLTVYRPADLS